MSPYYAIFNFEGFTKEDIAKNNWDGVDSAWRKSVEKTKHYIQVEIPDNDKRLRRCTKLRDVWLYLSDIFCLDEYEWTCA